MLDHIRQNRENMLNTFSNKDELIKGGPGSGRKIGKTRSGKDVYDTYAHPSHNDFTAEDHRDARKLNYDKAVSLQEGKAYSEYNGKNSKEVTRLHIQASNHSSAAEYGDVHKGEKVSMDKDELIDEHKKLVATLESNSHEDDKEEAKDQKKELKDLKKSEDLTPFEHQELIKSQIANSLYGSALTDEELEKSANDYFEKGKKAATIGEQRTFGGKEYIKVASGWRLVGKNKGKHKDVSEMLHGKKAAFQAGDKVKVAAAGSKTKGFVSHIEKDGTVWITRHDDPTPGSGGGWDPNHLAKLSLEELDSFEDKLNKQVYGADVEKMSDADVEAKYNQYKKVSSNPNFNEHGKKLLAKYEAEMNKRKGSKKVEDVETLAPDKKKADFIKRLNEGAAQHKEATQREENFKHMERLNMINLVPGGEKYFKELGEGEKNYTPEDHVMGHFDMLEDSNRSKARKFYAKVQAAYPAIAKKIIKMYGDSFMWD